MRIGIFGYGNLGRGVEIAIKKHHRAELVGIFTRRSPDSVSAICGVTKVYAADCVLDFKEKIDVLIICGGSAKDLPEMTPRLAEHFNVIDSFDTHRKIEEHFEKTDIAAKRGGNIALVSAGWDPGFFSLMRLYSEAFLPSGNTYTFWGTGISQGHSDAIRKIPGVIDAREYTVPIKESVDAVRRGEKNELSAKQMHRRECFVVAEDSADKVKIENEIKAMPDYFLGYDTSVSFVTRDEMKKKHSKLYHGGRVIRTGETGTECENSHRIEFSLKLDSNPEFTGSILLSFAGALMKMKNDMQSGAKTVFDVPPIYLIDKPIKEIYDNLL